MTLPRKTKKYNDARRKSLKLLWIILTILSQIANTQRAPTEIYANDRPMVTCQKSACKITQLSMVLKEGLRQRWDRIPWDSTGSS